MRLPASFAPGAILAFGETVCRFLGWTADGRAQLLGDEGLLTFPDRITGLPANPDKLLVLELLATGRLARRSPPLPDPVRERARRRRLTAKEAAARTSDRHAALRMAVLRGFDRDQPQRGDRALELWRDQTFDEVETRGTYGIWPAGSTLRKWIRERGRIDDRRWSDATSEKGRKRGPRRHRSVVAVAAYHAVYVAKATKGNVWSAWNLYCTDHDNLLAGEPLSFELAAPLPRPPGFPKAYGYERFRQLVEASRTPEVTQASRGRRGRRRRYGGGGASPEVTRLFEAVQLDAQSFPAFVVADVDRMEVVGTPWITLALERLCKIVPGFHVHPGAPSTTSLMRTIADVWRPSVVPARLVGKYPELALVGGAFDALEMDGGSENTSRAMQDLVGDVGFEMRIATPDEPMDKTDVERLQSTIQSFLADEVPSRVLDVRTVRELGLDPAAKAVIAFDVFVELVREAIMTYMVVHHDGLRTTPLEAFLAARARDGHDWPDDVDEWVEMAAEVEYDVRFDRNGFELECGLRYSCYVETPRLLAEEIAAARGLGTARRGYVKRKVKFHADDLGSASIWSDARGAYVRFPCTRPDYAEGLTLWLHERIRQFAGRTGRPLITEADQIEARAGLVALVRSVAESADPSILDMQFKLLATPTARACLGEAVDLLRAPASPDGPPDAIHRSTGAAARRDGSIPQPRSRNRKGGVPSERDAVIDELLSVAVPRGASADPLHGTPSPSGLEKRGRGTSAPPPERDADAIAAGDDPAPEAGRTAEAGTARAERTDPRGDADERRGRGGRTGSHEDRDDRDDAADGDHDHDQGDVGPDVEYDY